MNKLIKGITRDVAGMLMLGLLYAYFMHRAVGEIGLFTPLMITTGFLMIINLIKSWSRLK